MIGTIALGNGLPLLIAAGDVVPLINIGPIRPANPGHIERLAAVDIGNLIVAITNGGELPLVVLGIGNTTPLLNITAVGGTRPSHLHTFPAVYGFDQIDPIRHIGDRGEGESLVGAGVAAMLGKVDAIGSVTPDIGTFVAMGGD